MVYTYLQYTWIERHMRHRLTGLLYIPWSGVLGCLSYWSSKTFNVTCLRFYYPFELCFCQECFSVRRLYAGFAGTSYILGPEFNQHFGHVDLPGSFDFDRFS